MRYALYLLPDLASALWRAASALIGYDAARGELLPQPVLEGIAPHELAAVTQEPRRYGFHMTLKAPFRLAEGRSEAGLRAALAAFCAPRAAFALGSLALEVRKGQDGSGFLCLAPKARCLALSRLEQDALRGFEPFRAPLAAEEIARRAPDRLEPRQLELLRTFGYPYVLEEFRPHFTLTGRIDHPEGWQAPLRRWLAPAGMDGGMTITGIALLRQTGAGGYFRLIDFPRFDAEAPG